MSRHRGSTTTNEAQARSLQALRDKMGDAGGSFPRKGRRLGGSKKPGDLPRQTAPDTYSEGAFGWTGKFENVVKHPTRDEWVVRLGDVSDPELRKRLSASELATLDAAKAGEDELPDDWFEDGARAVAVRPR